MFYLSMDGYPDQPNAMSFCDYRGQYHDGAGSLSFAEGHTESDKWRDSRTTPPQLTPTGSGYPPPVASPNNRDLLWLQDLFAGRRDGSWGRGSEFNETFVVPARSLLLCISLAAIPARAQASIMMGRQSTDAPGVAGQPLFATSHWSVVLADRRRGSFAASPWRRRGCHTIRRVPALARAVLSGD